MFRFMAEIDEPDLAQALWDDANLLPANGDWHGLEVLDEGRDFDRGERWAVYNIQRLYLDFLEALEMREDTLPGDPARRELVFYQLGKFSQVISDYEAIYFTTEPRRSTRRSPSGSRPGARYYADADADVGYATPDAVTLATVHQSKGMQWPAVFLPCLRKNRFPSAAGRSASSTSSRTRRSPTPTATAARSRTRRGCSTSP